jgi:hypothetical protein
MYVRGSGQWNSGRLTLLGLYERGRDLANDTVFATNAVNSTVVSANVRVTRDWNVQGEAFRMRLVSSLNSESMFVQATNSLMLNPMLNQFQQWSYLFRVVRTFHWGGAARQGVSLDHVMAERNPITGSVEGFAWIVAAEGRQPAADVAVQLQSGRSTVTDVTGRYRFADVPEGTHSVSLDVERLPADYNAGPTVVVPIVVEPRRVARADFDLYRLSWFSGRVEASNPADFETLEGIVIRLQAGGVYTTTDKDGAFTFYNLTDGSYEVVVDRETLPAGAVVKTGEGAVVVSTGAAVPVVRITVEKVKSPNQPVRKVFETTITTRR